MKILILHKWLVMGGIEKILINYLYLFKELGYQVELFIKYDLRNNNLFEKNIPKKVNYEFAFPLSHFKQIERIKSQRKAGLIYRLKYEIYKYKEKNKFNKKIIQKIEDNNYDIVIDFSECLDNLIRGKNHKKIIRETTTLRWIHNQLDIKEKDKKQKTKYNRIFSNHTKVIAICEGMKNRITKQLNYKKDNLSVIHNYINSQEVIKKSNLASLEYQYYLDQKYILQVSRLVNGKGHIELIEIYKQLKEKGITHKLFLIGEGENRTLLENKINELSLQDDCILLGEISNPYPFFKNADLFVHTSESEGLPTVLLESMVCGVPVVAMDCPTGPRDIIGENDEYGKLIPMHDKLVFAKAVVELLTKKELYEFYSRKSLERSTDFSKQKIMREIDYLFNSLNNSR